MEFNEQQAEQRNHDQERSIALLFAVPDMSERILVMVVQGAHVVAHC